MGVKIVLSAGGTEGRKGGGREEGGREAMEEWREV